MDFFAKYELKHIIDKAKGKKAIIEVMDWEDEFTFRGSESSN